MATKSLIWIGIFVGSIVGSTLGSALDHGNFLGLWSILLGGIGSLVGIYAGYKISNT